MFFLWCLVMPRYFPDVSYFLFPHIGHESPSGRVSSWESIWVSTFTYFCLFGSSLKTKNLKICAWIQGQNINIIPGQPLDMYLCKVGLSCYAHKAHHWMSPKYTLSHTTGQQWAVLLPVSISSSYFSPPHKTCSSAMCFWDPLNLG